jgi:organic hydroperoxide reductase OsmC/OhrA
VTCRTSCSTSGRSGVASESMEAAISKLATVPTRFRSRPPWGGKGEGTSPEELLTLAVCACFTATLFALLARARLAVDRVEVAARGVVAEYPGEQAHFAEVRVSPTVHGGEAEKLEEYVKFACRARDRCFIGRTFRGNVAYEVGEVSVEGRHGSERVRATCSVFAPAAAAPSR